MPIRAFVFDIDDTLISTTKNTIRARWRCLEFVLGELGGIPDERAAGLVDRLYDVFGWSRLRDLWRSLAVELGLPDPGEAVLDGAATLFEEVFFDGLHALSTVESTLVTLSSRPVEMGIISDGDEELQRRKLRATGLDRFFEAERVIVTIQSDLYSAKPSSANFRRMEKLLDVRAHEAVYVGDKPWDVTAANVAGWTSIRSRQAAGFGVWPSPSLAIQKPDLEIDTLAEILELE